ncbi:MAG: arylsulfatase A-like enzyme [Pseudohongiellaceae bacterium]
MVYRVGSNTDYKTPGEKGSWIGIGSGNVTVAGSPLLYYKFHANEGGLRVPLVMSGPGISQRGEMNNEFTFVTDLAPTILSLVGIDDHEGSWNGKTVEPIVGTNFADYLAGITNEIHSPSEPIGYELGGSSVLFKGDYKIVINRTEQNETEWHLFNIKTDPGEVSDLKDEQPQLFEEMLADYEMWEQANNVLPMPVGYNRGRTIFRGGFN